MIEHPEITGHAELLAQRQGHRHGSVEFYEAVKSNFEDHMQRHDAPVPPKPQAAPAPEAPLQEPRNRSSLVSAPVSKETYANGSYDSYGDRPGTVRLTVSQKEAARFSGLTEAEYALQVLRLREEKANGNYHGGNP